MKNISSLLNHLLLVLFAVTPSFALSAERFLDDLSFGVSVLQQESSLTLTTADNNTRYTDDATGIELYAEHYHQGKYRYKGSFAYIAYEGFDITEAVVSADLLMPLNPQFSLFAGAASGAALQQFPEAGVSDSSVGLIYGGQLGGIYYLNRHLMAELGYRLRLTSLKTEVNGANNSFIEFDQLDEIYISLLLMF
ncbi:MAG TPA: hypothetical protein VIQ81_00855 [Gammaproteobacteria bacterium]